MKLLKLSLLIAALLIISGCVTNLNCPHQLIYVETPPVTGAHCTLQNDQGCWTLPCTPGMLVIARSNSDLLVHVQKCGYQDAYLRVTPRPLLSRLVWSRVSPQCGVCSDYPNALHIHLEPLCGY